MTKIPRDVDGAWLISRLCKKCGYSVIRQKGSHVRLECDSPKHRLTVALHDPIPVGTLNVILEDVQEAQGLSREEIMRLIFK